MLHVELDSIVGDFMRRTLYFLDPEDSCAEAAKIMMDSNVGSVFVAEGGVPVGIVTERDMLSKVLGEGRKPDDVKLKDIMSSPIISVSPHAKVAEALEIMAHNGFRRLLVMDGEKPVGIIAQRFTIQEEVEFLRSKAYEPAEDAMRYHPFYQGKMEVSLKVPVRSIDDFAIWYTPGVAEPCKDIKSNPLRVFDHTNKGNTIAIVTDGTRVLGLGDIGPEAALPVMEGKALLFRYLGGVDAHPICLNTTDPDEFIAAVKAIQPAYGGVNLEDIAQPKCFDILERLEKEAEIPVWHDDQQGTATVVLAGFLNALNVVNKSLDQVRVTLIGAGASNIRTARLMMAAGVDPTRLIVVDSTGILHAGRDDLEEHYQQKWEIAQVTNGEGRTGGIREALKRADAVVALSRPGPGVITTEDISVMAAKPIVFACANPIPEIWPWEAADAGAGVVATGRSDFPNQVNNSLGFPGIFRGVLDVRSTRITDEMCIAAAKELALIAEEKGLHAQAILPTMEDWELFPRVAAAVGMKAQELRFAQLQISKEDLYKAAHHRIERARAIVENSMERGFIQEPPQEETVIYEKAPA
jgi:malate dehydrogenase (oxaloacetate-decarboxylating)